MVTADIKGHEDHAGVQPQLTEAVAGGEEQAPRATPLGLFAAAVGFLLPIVYSPGTPVRYWAGRYVLMLVVAGVGLPILLARPEPRLKLATWAARGFLVIALISTLLSENPDLSAAGRWNQGSGYLFLVAAAGAWAIGVRLSPEDRALLRAALIGAVAVSVVAAIASVAFDLERYGLGTPYGRAMAFLGNPVHLGPFCAAGLALVIWSLRRRPWLLAACAVPVGAAIALAGSPIGLGLMLLPVGWAVRRTGWRAGVLCAITLSLGVFGSQLLGSKSPTPATADPESSESLGETRGGSAVQSSLRGRNLTPRLGTWAAGAEAWVNRPIVGYGPSMYGAATLHLRPLSVVHADSTPTLYNDAHNAVVEVAVTTGLLGLFAFAFWIVAATRHATGALGLFAAIVGVAHLYQPIHIGTALPALLALGAAAAADVPARLKRGGNIASGTLAAVGVVLGAIFLFGAFRLNQARLDNDLEDAKAAAALLRPWAEPYNRESLIHQYDFVTGDPNAGPRALAALEKSTLREPHNPRIWHLLGNVALSHGEHEVARVAFLEALRLDPWSQPALMGMVRLELGLGHEPEARSWADQAIMVNPDLKP